MPEFARRFLARQLGDPSGPFGHYIARRLNQNNEGAIRAAIETLDLTGSEAVADIGFGGGVGLDLLLERLGRDGRVVGIDPSPTMVARARRGRRAAVRSGRLRVAEGGLGALPVTDGGLDAWITLNTIYFLDDLPAAAAELARVLGAGGRGVVGIADPAWMREQPVVAHGFRVRELEEVLASLGAGGLTVEPRSVRREGRPLYHLLVCRRAE